MIQMKNLEYLGSSNPKPPKKLIPFMWYFIVQMKEQFGAIFILFSISAIILACIPLFIQWIVEGIEQVDDPKNIWDYVFWPFLSFIIIVLIFQPIVVQWGNYIQAHTLPHFGNMVRRQLAIYMHRHSYRYYQEDFAGRLAGKVVETPSAMNEVMYTAIGAFLFGFINFLVSIILYATVNVWFGLIGTLWIGSYFLLLYYFIPKVQRLSKYASEERSKLRGRYVDILTNILTVKLFARAKHEDTYLRESLWKTADGFVKNDIMLWRLWICLEALTGVMWGATFFFAIYGYQHGFVSLPQFVMIVPLTWQLSNMTWWLSEIFANFFQKLGEIQEGMEAIVKAQEVLDDCNAKDLEFKKDSITFKNVCFNYGDKIIFDNLNITIPAGQKVGLVGASGAGKSTLVQILLRLFDIDKGTITIGDQNIAQVTQDSLRSHIGVIPQASDLLHRSIRDNIRYGDLNATEDQIVEAAQKAHAHDFIQELKDQYGNTGYDAQVGERGVKLSGGQRQRIAIARAILKNAPILILDEATSALDSESEKLIQDSLFQLMEGKTVIAIAHRLSTIAHLDRLLIMQDGKIIEDGGHEELLALNGYYARLWSMQSGGFLKPDKEKKLS